MEFLNFTAATLAFLAVFAVLASPAVSLNCTSQKFTNRMFAACDDLPHLSSYLHYTYNASNSSLSVAFVATPSKPEGWISWGINPTGTKMIGTQALVAFKSKGSVVVKTYDLSTFDLMESKLSFDVWDLSAQDVAGEMTIFASVKVPAKAVKVNQLWQVGPSVSAGGVPTKHDMLPENMKATATLALTASSGNGTAAGGTNSTGGATEKSGGDARKMEVGMVLSSLAILVGSLFVA